MRFPWVRRKWHEYEITLLHQALEGHRATISERDKLIHEYEKRWKSTDGKLVLKDLQSALNLIRTYHQALYTMSVADPNLITAEELLQRWGMTVNADAPFLGFKGLRPTRSEEPVANRIEREEKEYGEEAYGSGRVEMVVEDAGPDEEEGYRRGRIRFIDKNSEREPDQIDDLQEIDRLTHPSKVTGQFDHDDHEGEGVTTTWAAYPGDDIDPPQD